MIAVFICGALLASCDDKGNTILVEIVQSSPDDLGEVRVSDEAVREVTIRNISSDAVAVTLEMSSCGCLTTSFEREVLEPGEETQFRMATVVLAERGVKSQTALIRATLAKNADVFQFVRVDMKYMAAVEYYVHPLRVILHHQADDEGKSLITLTPHSTTSIRVVESSINIDGVELHIGEAVKTDKGLGTTLVLQSGIQEPGAYDGVLRVTTDSTDHPEFGIPVRIRVYPPGGREVAPIVLDQILGEVRASATVEFDKGMIPVEVDGALSFSVMSAVPGLGVHPKGDVVEVTCDFSKVVPAFGEATLLVRDDSGAVLLKVPIVWISDLASLHSPE